MTEETPKCVMCGYPLSARAVENGYKYCWQCWTKSKEEANGSGNPGPAASRHERQDAGEEHKKGSPEENLVITMTEPKEGDEIDGVPVIFSYSTEQAVEDGVLVYVGNVGRNRVYFSRALFDQGYEDQQKRIEFVNRGLALLRKPDAEDTEYMRLRVIEEGKSWIIQEPGKYTLLEPSDY